jgi:2,4-dienoyl-CoA reductase-like NADH-dependent reductase (Old Yellow Enzyme family)
MSTKLTETLQLPCGALLKNRLGKSAMSENMGSLGYTSNEKFNRLYGRWAEGGIGLLITGNVMVDRFALGEAHNVVIEQGIQDPNLPLWAEAGKKNGTHGFATKTLSFVMTSTKRENVAPNQ